MKYKVGDLVGIGWNGKLQQPNPAIVVRVIEHTFGGYMYVVRPVTESAPERWSDGSRLTPWSPDKK